MLLAMSNERFCINAERKERFRTLLLESCSSAQGKSGWEDPVARRERKRTEGLMRKRLLESQKGSDPAESETSAMVDDINDTLY